MPKKTPLLLAVLAMASPALAAVDTYVIDSDHTFPSIEFSHMGVSVWRGKFNRTVGTIKLDRAARTGTVDVVVDADSIDFGLDSMHKEARSENFFDVARYPKVTYKGTVQFSGDRPASVDGQVTIMGVTRPVALKINLFNCIVHPVLKKEVCGADAEGELNWAQYGMKLSKYGEGDAGKVRLRIQVEGFRQD